MKHARSDYDAIQPWPTKRAHTVKQDGQVLHDAPIYRGKPPYEPLIPDDEPVFLVRGQDLAAIPTAEAWCKAAEELGADAGIIDAVRRHIEVVREWQATHVAKVPDAPDSALRGRSQTVRSRKRD